MDTMPVSIYIGLVCIFRGFLCQECREFLTTFSISILVLVMAAYARSKDDRAVEHIQMIIRDMEELSQGSETSAGNPQIAPDRISYTTLMRAHISLGKAGFAERVESILCDLRQQESNPLAKPDERMYSVVLDAWDRSGDPNAHTRAEALILEMNDDFAAGNKLVQPTVICMNSRKSPRTFFSSLRLFL
jgi:hypothetical protein